MISQIETAMARYSAFTEDLETICCFLDLHKIKESPQKKPKHVIDLRESGQPA